MHKSISRLGVMMIDKFFNVVSVILVLVGGLNWGLVGIANFDFVQYVLGSTILTKLIYTLVGLAALFQTLRILSSINNCWLCPPPEVRTEAASESHPEPS